MSPPNILPSELFSHLNEFRLQNRFYDVVIKVEDRTFHCHRIILASAFKYFRSMFCKNFKEADKEEIELKGILADDFELLLTHVYGGLVSFHEENVCRLLRLAHYLCLQTLEDACVKYLLDKGDEIKLNTAIYIFEFASKIGKNILLEKFAGCMAKNFEKASKNETFLRVNAVDLLKIFKHPDLMIDNSLVLLSFLEEWVQFHSENDRRLLPELLNAVDLKEVPREWLLKALTIRYNPSLSSPAKITNENTEEKTCMTAAENLFIDEKEDTDEISLNQDENKLPFILYTLETHKDVSYGRDHSFINLYQFENHDTVWPMNVISKIEGPSDKCSLTMHYHGGDRKTQFLFCKSILINNVHYFIVMQDSPSCDGYDKDNKKWTDKYYYYSPYICSELKRKKELPVFDYNSKGKDILNALTITACGSNIYLYTDGEFVMLNCQTHEWTRLNMGNFEKTAFPNLLSYNDSLYLIGGKHPARKGPESGYSLKVYHISRSGRIFQHFDPRTGKWSHLPTLGYARSKSASYVYNDTLYVTGGEDRAYFEGYLECFDFKAGKWYDFKTSMPEPKFNHTLLAHDNQLWFFGGQNYKDTKIVEDLTWCSYNLRENTWSDSFQLPLNHHGFRVEKILDVAKI